MDDKSNLESEKDDCEESEGDQESRRVFSRSAEAGEGDKEDDATDCDEDHIEEVDCGHLDHNILKSWQITEAFLSVGGIEEVVHHLHHGVLIDGQPETSSHEDEAEGEEQAGEDVEESSETHSARSSCPS